VADDDDVDMGLFLAVRALLVNLKAVEMDGAAG
jgi:hypothetical protein